jgi:sugar lactone lactonase YvrE
MTLRRLLRWGVVVVAALGACLLFLPTPLDPYAWTPPANPGTGAGSRFSPTQPFDGLQTLAQDVIGKSFAAAGKPVNFGPEDVAVSPRDGKVYTGIGNGDILRIDPASGSVEKFADTGGRPLGMAFARGGDTLYVADAHRGLLAVDPEGRVRVLVDQLGGKPLRFTDNLDVAGDGTIWFSAPTRDHTLEQVELDVWDSRPSGRLLRHDPRTGETEVVLDNLFYANGVAVADDDSFVLVAEFLAYRITRYWLSGPRKHSHEVFVDGLPGYPDNVTRTPEGNFLVGLSLERIAALDAQRPRPWAIRVMYRLPPFLQKQPQYPGYLMEFDRRGALRRFAAAEQQGKVAAQVTAGTVLPAAAGESEEDVVVGSLLVQSVRRLKLQKALPDRIAGDPTDE